MPFPSSPGFPSPPGTVPWGASAPYRGASPARDATPRFNRAAIVAFLFAFAAPVLGVMATSLLGALMVLTADDIGPLMTILSVGVFGVLLAVLVALAWLAITGIRRTGQAGMSLVVVALTVGVPSLLAGVVVWLVTDIGG